MPQFIIAYRGGKQPSSPEEGQAHMQKWKDWVASLGSAMINPGTPLGASKFINANGVSDEGPGEALNGYAIFEADDMDAAIEIAKGDPFTAMGTLELAEIKSFG